MRKYYINIILTILLIACSKHSRVLKNEPIEEVYWDKIFIKNNLSDTIEFMYFPFKINNIMYNTFLMDSCIQNEGENTYCMYNEELLTRKNPYLQLRTQGNQVSLILPPKSNPVLVGVKYFFFIKMATELAYGNVNIRIKQRNINSIAILNANQVMKKDGSYHLLIDTILTKGSIDSTSFLCKRTNTSFEIIANNILKETVFLNHGKSIINFYSHGKIDSIMLKNKKIVKIKCP